MLTDNELFEIFHARALTRIIAAKESNQRFAYYTSGATAREVLARRQLWMRLPLCMNDFSEVEHGLALFFRTWESEHGKTLQLAVDAVHSGSSQRLTEQLRLGAGRQLFSETFVACVSEHDASDDEFGRLSMWRAYGGDDGVALVFDGSVFDGEDVDIGAYYSPVEYLSDQEFADEFVSLAERIVRHRARLQKLSALDFDAYLLHAAKLAVLCIKHPAFREEREWRIFAWPKEEIGRTEPTIEVVAGVPQPVVKLPLTDHAGRSTFSKLDRILIGPTSYPVAMHIAMRELLDDNEVSDADKKVHLTRVPLRPRKG